MTSVKEEVTLEEDQKVSHPEGTSFQYDHRSPKRVKEEILPPEDDDDGQMIFLVEMMDADDDMYYDSDNDSKPFRDTEIPNDGIKIKKEIAAEEAGFEQHPEWETKWYEPNVKLEIQQEVTTETAKLEEHSELERRQQKFKCQYCTFHCGFEVSLRVHMEALHAELVQDCAESEQKEKKFACNRCDFRSTFRKSLQTHIEVAHAEDRTVRCSICNSLFTGVMKYKQHIEQVHQGFEQECKICLELYHKGHGFVHRIECPGRLLFECGFCDKIFVKKEGLSKHLDQHDVSEDNKELFIRETRQKDQFFTCISCEDDRAYTKDPYWKHIKDDHDGYHLRCPDCGSMFRSYNVRHAHKKKFCRVGEARERFETEPLQCPKCVKVYHNRASLEVHLSRIHTNKPSKCNFCDKEFPTLGTLNYHKAKEHLIPKLSCSHCELKFHDKYKLHRHESSHRELMCEKCGLTFKAPIYLANHMRFQHIHKKKEKQEKKPKKRDIAEKKRKQPEPEPRMKTRRVRLPRAAKAGRK